VKKNIQMQNVNKSLSNKFTKYMKRYRNLYISLAKKTKKNIRNFEKKSIIVDLSLGPGLLSKELNNQITNAMIIGLDPSQNMINIAKEELSECKNCNIVLSSAEQIPIQDSIVDIIVSRFGISSWRDVKKGISEIKRILKPNGTLILEFLNKDFPNWKILIMKIKMYIKGAGRELINYNVDCYKTAYSSVNIEKFLKEFGFKIIEKKGKSGDWKYLIIASKI
jgi:ubiquinone/menaquinone biosynthesis C-methylase UbiE